MPRALYRGTVLLTKYLNPEKYVMLNVTRSNTLTIMKNENWAARRKLHAGGDAKLEIEFAMHA